MEQFKHESKKHQEIHKDTKNEIKPDDVNGQIKTAQNTNTTHQLKMLGDLLNCSDTTTTDVITNSLKDNTIPPPHGEVRLDTDELDLDDLLGISNGVSNMQNVERLTNKPDSHAGMLGREREGGGI